MRTIAAFFLVSLTVFWSPAVHAVCPICTVAVAGGLEISRWLGVDDVVTGLWIGGLIVSSGLWIAGRLGRQYRAGRIKEIIAVAGFFLLVVVPLHWTKRIGLPGNRLWGMDKPLLGIVCGMAVFAFAVGMERWLKKIHRGKAYLSYQKVLIPLLFLSLASLVFYLITS
ncbi:hypothetical protein M1523_03265 [Patescibacteria group bacterium]|nr:hypothetical protein [Patescibacteria group bacterium]MCL5091259.1 hypothetical protein [Patescibacteria group bacterium]